MAGQVVMWRQNGIKHYGRHAKRKRWMRLLFQCFWVGCEELQMAASEPDFPDAAKDDLLPCNLRIWSRWLLRDCSWLEFTINAYHFANAKTNSTGLLTYRDDVVFSFIQIVLKIKVYYLTKKLISPEKMGRTGWKERRAMEAEKRSKGGTPTETRITFVSAGGTRSYYNDAQSTAASSSSSALLASYPHTLALSKYPLQYYIAHITSCRC